MHKEDKVFTTKINCGTSALKEDQGQKHKDNSHVIESKNDFKDMVKPGIISAFDKKCTGGVMLNPSGDGLIKSRNLGQMISQSLTANNPSSSSKCALNKDIHIRNTVESTGKLNKSIVPFNQKNKDIPRATIDNIRTQSFVLNLSNQPPLKQDTSVKKMQQSINLVKSQKISINKVSQSGMSYTNSVIKQTNPSLSMPSKPASANINHTPQVQNSASPHIITEEARYPSNQANISLLKGKSKDNNVEMSSVFTFKPSQPQPLVQADNKKSLNQFLVSTLKKSVDSIPIKAASQGIKATQINVKLLSKKK